MNFRQVTFSVLEDFSARQPRILDSFLSETLPRAPPGSLFVGAGDSYASSSIANYLSSMRYQAVNPYELTSAIHIATGRAAYFVTVSGNTASSIAAARAARGIAERSSAITANAKGGIAAVVDEVIFIPFHYVPRLPGTLSFSLSLLALLKLASGRFKCDFAGVSSQARRDAKRLAFSDGGTTHFLGNNAAFPIGQYCALKVYEFLGARAQADRLEEFSHAPIFALRKHDTVNVFCAFDPFHVGQKLATSLHRSGFNATAIPPFGSNSFEQAFYFIFLAQFALLERAKSEGRSLPYFVGARSKLAVSDSMIY